MVELKHSFLYLNKDLIKRIALSLNKQLKDLTTLKRVRWSFETLPQKAILSSSFGIQSAAILKLITYQIPGVYIIVIDTGYLFRETYRHIEKLTLKLNLNTYINRSNISSKWQELKYGKLWSKGKEGIILYNKLNKVNPMNYILKKHNIKTWIAGLRNEQSNSRFKLLALTINNNIFKLLPIIDLNGRDLFFLLRKYKITYNPLWNIGYVSLGDVHTTCVYKVGMKEEATRFYGIKRECGLH
ncbi:phosphoadenylyl-sulfate reductase [Candidatus Tremblaya phenacola]|uniref:Phosphoadenosine phosphosulfate reductase n=1 Tax=Candidatus Tremblayella phenacoccinincola TaxID=1010676 RepID=A0A2G0V6Q3_9PROT|nr:phosphoadenylyl-sulfate reductase [Candidatus Tremblaya phenacola]PHN16178.1 Phosphoadenosine phosphosulfate reductase [Candidatus Tremblaya phenacola]